MIALTPFKPKITVKKADLGTYWMVTLLGAIILVASGLVGFREV